MYIEYIPIYIIDRYIFQSFSNVFQVVTDHKQQKSLGSNSPQRWYILRCSYGLYVCRCQKMGHVTM